MVRKPNIHGGGSRTNLNGLSFEGRTDFIESVKKNKNFTLKRIPLLKKTYNIVFKDKNIGFYTEKNEFYNFFLKKEEVNWTEFISKKYLPDAVLINQINQTVYIIEKKFQSGSGSVDEKLQTCDFKKKIYTKMITKCKNIYKTEYYYLLNSWYERGEYRDVKNYIISVGCRYFIDKIDFKDLGIS
tara:strand:- start:4654 stop:5208 length:555 start_codon:yes stop_codon:yes gene_type:complete